MTFFILLRRMISFCHSASSSSSSFAWYFISNRTNKGGKTLQSIVHIRHDHEIWSSLLSHSMYYMGSMCRLHNLVCVAVVRVSNSLKHNRRATQWETLCWSSVKILLQLINRCLCWCLFLARTVFDFDLLLLFHCIRATKKMLSTCVYRAIATFPLYKCMQTISVFISLLFLFSFIIIIIICLQERYLLRIAIKR